jgi:hypothetical protein
MLSSCLVGNIEVGRFLWHPQPWCLVVAASCMLCETAMQPGTENKSIFQLCGAHPIWPWRNTRLLRFHGAWARGALMCARAILVRPFSFSSSKKLNLLHAYESTYHHAPYQSRPSLWEGAGAQLHCPHIINRKYVVVALSRFALSMILIRDKLAISMQWRNEQSYYCF